MPRPGYYKYFQLNGIIIHEASRVHFWDTDEARSSSSCAHGRG